MDTSKRLVSLDIFRGMTIALMILVNNAGDWGNVYAPLLHADWDGCTPTDLVFPFFLFIVGVSIALALGKRKEAGYDHGAIIKKILSRTAIIFAIGIFLNAFPYFDLSNIRIAGVLPRIALVYGISALIFLKAKNWKTVAWTCIALLLAYWLMMAMIPVPIDDVLLAAIASGEIDTAHGMFTLEPLTKISDNYIAPNLQRGTNLEAYIDRLLTPGRLYQKTWDPEGLLSTIPSVGTCLIGVLTGLWIKTKTETYKKLTGILGAGALLLGLAYVWSLAFPFNKNLWSSSYVLLTGGLALLCLGVIYWLVDVLGYKKGTRPFVIYGMNALAVYVLSGIVADLFNAIKWTSAAGETISLKGWVYHTFMTPLLNDYNASFAWALFNVLLTFVVAWVLYKKKIFIKV